VTYIALSSAAQHLGMKLTLAEAGHKAVLSAPGAHAEFEADTRDITINGLRVFLGEPVTMTAHELRISRIDFDRCVAPLLRPGYAVDAPRTPKIIVLDPGHGGGDAGTDNKKLGLFEKVLTLDVALRLQKLLEASGYTVVMTRTTDKEFSPKKEIDLPMRAEIANRAHADLFISIHFNAAPVNTRGTEVYTFAPAQQHSTEWWSILHNSTGDALDEPQPVNRFDHWSVVFAQSIHRELLRTLKTEDRGKKIAHWAVLKTLECPGILVEPTILSNDGEAKRTAQPEFRQQIAEALAAGIRDYAATVETVRAKRGTPTATTQRRQPSRSS
jgi:N-acetylmuramoyl-L-alanine amidase